MSEIRVTTLKDTAGSNSSTAAEIYSGRAKAWVNFNGSGTVAIRQDFNVNSITDNTTGDYTVNFSNALSDANYCPIFGCEQYDAGSANYTTGIKTAPFNGSAVLMSTSQLRIFNQTGSGTNTDLSYVTVAIFR